MGLYPVRLGNWLRFTAKSEPIWTLAIEQHRVRAVHQLASFGAFFNQGPARNSRLPSLMALRRRISAVIVDTTGQPDPTCKACPAGAEAARRAEPRPTSNAGGGSDRCTVRSPVRAFRHRIDKDPRIRPSIVYGVEGQRYRSFSVRVDLLASDTWLLTTDHWPLPSLTRCPMRLLFASIHSYLDPSSGAALCDAGAAGAAGRSWDGLPGALCRGARPRA